MFVVAYYVIFYLLSALLGYFDPELFSEDTSVKAPLTTGGLIVETLRDMLHYLAFGVMVILLRNVRETLRAKYAIPASHEQEDCLCSLVCPCLVAAQMLRHTTDYDLYPATCCTERGIPAHAPSIV